MPEHGPDARIGPVHGAVGTDRHVVREENALGESEPADDLARLRVELADLVAEHLSRPQVVVGIKRNSVRATNKRAPSTSAVLPLALPDVGATDTSDEPFARPPSADVPTSSQTPPEPPSTAERTARSQPGSSTSLMLKPMRGTGRRQCAQPSSGRRYACRWANASGPIAAVPQ